MGCAARTLSGIWGDNHRKFAKHPIPSCEPVWAICSLQNFLQDRRCNPNSISMLERFGEQLDFD